MINTQINTSTISFEKIMSEFAKYLFNNRIRFNLIFPSIKLDQIVNNQTISAETLKLGFQNASFPLSEKEFSVIMTHFDPINKSKVLVEELKHEISKYEPKYFSQSYQRINTEEIDNKLAIKSREFEKSPNFGKMFVHEVFVVICLGSLRLMHVSPCLRRDQWAHFGCQGSDRQPT